MTQNKKSEILLNRHVKDLKVVKENGIKNTLTNLLSYIYLRINYEFDEKFIKFKEYDKFLSNDHSKGMLGIIPNHNYSLQPMNAEDYFRKRVIKKKESLVN